MEVKARYVNINSQSLQSTKIQGKKCNFGKPICLQSHVFSFFFFTQHSGPKGACRVKKKKSANVDIRHCVGLKYYWATSIIRGAPTWFLLAVHLLLEFQKLVLDNQSYRVNFWNIGSALQFVCWAPLSLIHTFFFFEKECCIQNAKKNLRYVHVCNCKLWIKWLTFLFWSF